MVQVLRPDIVGCRCGSSVEAKSGQSLIELSDSTLELGTSESLRFPPNSESV